MSSIIKTTTKFLFTLIGLFLIYVILCIGHGTYTDYRPEGSSVLNIEAASEPRLIQDSTLSFFSWNLGYGALGAECNFFYNGGGFFYAGDKMIRPPKELVDKNIEGILNIVKSHPADFYVLQEVDYESKRSYCYNQYDAIKHQLGNLPSSFATNFRVSRVPIPVFQPWDVYGCAESGLATYSRYRPLEVKRYQLPGEYEWPDRIFQLDRCAAVSRFSMQNGKELVLVNIHNSAYDKGGLLKQQQMAYLRQFFLTEYEKGNYLVAGGDWNQSPPGFPYFSFRPDTKRELQPHYNINADFAPQGWTWVYDPSYPTSRSTKELYQKDQTFVQLIDFYLISPNLEALEVKTINHDFEHSDHQPVWMEVKMK